jgi:hypothetical protein
MRGDYKNGKIYQIISNDGEMCYVGSTCKKYLSQRFGEHKNKYRDKQLGKGGSKNSYAVFEIFDKYGVDGCSIELIENCPCENINELRKREGYYIRQKQLEYICVNHVVPDRTTEEYEKMRNTRKFKCECGGHFSLHHVSTHSKTLQHINFVENKIFDILSKEWEKNNSDEK